MKTPTACFTSAGEIADRQQRPQKKPPRGGFFDGDFVCNLAERASVLKNRQRTSRTIRVAQKPSV